MMLRVGSVHKRCVIKNLPIFLPFPNLFAPLLESRLSNALSLYERLCKNVLEFLFRALCSRF